MKTPLFLFALFLSPLLMAKKPAILSPFDSLAIEGQNVVLKVKAEQDKVFPFRPDIKDVFIEFSQNSQVLGKAKTDDDGFAKLEISTDHLDQGVYSIDLKLVNNREFTADQEVIQLSIWPVDQRLIVTDIDQTISDVESRNVILRPVTRQNPFEGSQEALKEIKKRGYKIVYLTAREDALFQLTKSWLSYHQFPEGHLIMWDVDVLERRTPWNHGQYKTAALTKLKEKFPFVAAGFGDKPHDIQAYEVNGIDAYLVRSRHNQEVSFPVGTKEFQDWSSVLDLLEL